MRNNRLELQENDLTSTILDPDSLEREYKKKEVAVYTSPKDMMDVSYMYNRLSRLCKKDIRYSILTRVCFVNNLYDSETDDVTDWKTLDEQISITCDEQFRDNINNFLYSIKDRLSSCMEIYDFKDLDIQGFQLLLYRIQYTDTVVAKQKLNLNSLGERKDLINVSNVSKGFDYLPLSLDKDKLGKSLLKTIKGDMISSITLLDGTNVNFIDRVNNYSSAAKKLSKFSDKTDFYQSNDSNNIITVEKTSSNKEDLETTINVYNTNGIKISRIVDKQIDHNNFTRLVGNFKAYIDSKGVYNRIINMLFSYIYPNKISGYFSKLIYSDSRIGTLDLETYKDKHKNSKTYAIGYYAKDILETFYIEKDLNSDALIMRCLDSMLVKTFDGFTFYVHNLGRFDIYFLLKVIIDTCDAQPNVYKYKITPRDRTILCIKITKKVSGKTYGVKIVDSYNFLSSSLDKLSKTFNCEVKKGFFPYNFVSTDTLFYKGDKPNKSFYGDIISDTYNEINSKNWSLKHETTKYLEKDLISLYEVMNTFKLRIYSKYHTHMTRNLTISGLAMDIFLRRFYDKNIPLINKKSVYNDIKKSYYGGITEVYKPYGKDLYYYDVNSLYPFAALNPMPGLKCCYIDNIDKNISQYINDMFGFYYCKIKVIDGYLGLLPYRTDSGIIMPKGEYEGWYFSEELKYAYRNGYTIDVMKGYKFETKLNVFNKYVKEFYDIKSSTTDPIERSIAKSLLNNLLGRFGMNIDKYITELVDEKKFNEIVQSKKIVSITHIGNKILVTHGSKVSLDICNNHDVDFLKTFNNDINNNKKSGFTEDRLHDVSIAIASAVTSYSRIFMNEVKLDILKRKGSIYYTDTDSIVTDIKMDDKSIGNELGKFKLEHKIKEGYFISNKNYSFKDSNGNIFITRSGVNNKSLKFEDYEKLYSGTDVLCTRTESIKNYGDGYINIGIDRDIILSANSYTKRNKVYRNSLWVDTEPIILSKDGN